MQTRRDFVKLAVAGLALPRLADAGAIDSRVGGVMLGAQSYSFRDVPRDAGGDAVGPLIKAFTAVNLGDCELWAPQIEPASDPRFGRGAPNTPEVQKGREAAREALHSWRVTRPSRTSPASEALQRCRHHDPLLQLRFAESFSDAEIERGSKSQGPRRGGDHGVHHVVGGEARVVPFAEKHRMAVAMHNHSNTKDT